MELAEIHLGLNLEADKEELFWEQRTRANWLKHGDRNTAYFHKMASGRKKMNFVKGLEDELGRWVSDQE